MMASNPQKAKAQRRRYYLHRRIRKFARLDTRHRTVFVPFLFEANEKEQFYFNELRQRYGYAVQVELPM